MDAALSPTCWFFAPHPMRQAGDGEQRGWVATSVILPERYQLAQHALFADANVLERTLRLRAPGGILPRR